MSVQPDQHSIDRFEPDESPIAEYLSEIVRLPGYWPVDAECKELKPVGFCDRGHVQIGAKKPCGTRTCPEHWYQWRRRSAANLVAQLAAYRYAQGGPRARGRRMIHAISSPPQDQRWTCNTFWSMRTDSYDPVAEAGGRGGVAIPHAYRVSEEGDELFSEAVAAGLDPAYGKWRFIRGLADDWEDMGPLIEVAPHVHDLVAVDDLDGETVEEIEEETGWTVSNVRSLAPFYIDTDEVPFEAVKGDLDRYTVEAVAAAQEATVREGYESMARLSMYLMSHAAVQPETGHLQMRQTVTYWGEVHAFDPEAELSREEWETIQRYAAEAVGGVIPEEVEGDHTGRVCSREDCEAFVYELVHLTDKLATPEWIESLPVEQAWEMWGLKVVLNDRPPPGVESLGASPIPEWVDGEKREKKESTVPPGGFERSAASSAPAVTTEAEYLEWLRRLGRSRIDQNPFYRIGEARS